MGGGTRKVTPSAAPLVVAADAAACQRLFHYLARGVCCASGKCHEKKMPFLESRRLVRGGFSGNVMDESVPGTPVPMGDKEQVVHEVRFGPVGLQGVSSREYLLRGKSWSRGLRSCWLSPSANEYNHEYDPREGDQGRA